ncbi:spindle and kinetochore-associated protein 3 isoform X2 [Microcaecilia unicolor]|uniref:Spindle and kinetochore-associated protein 3 isoform X2 n=1 Tax=Microcaecilia unicolor TaxID=1415580 RepID=A0A6P7XL80_9AMPH|nr:spindle and kinetochore-associated protein 3 isoform X2 [Microcaecilia unicolor]
MAVTAHFFEKLRALALTLEKETQHLEHAFNNDDLDFNGYEDESPMRILHDLHSEMRALKGSMQSTIDQTHSKAEEITEFLKTCKVVKQRIAVDLENIKELFEKYGYKLLSVEDQGKEQESGCDNPDTSDHEHLHKIDLEQIENKLPAHRDLPQTPQLSAFGLSHYQFHTRNVSNITALNGITAVKEEPNSIQVPEDRPELVMPRTPKCTLYMDDDALLESCFPKLEPFSVGEYHMKLNDDYTMALIKRAQESKNVPEGKGTNVHAERPAFFHDITTPVPSSQLSHMSGADNINSPLPPIFCTPGIKIHKKENIKPVETLETAHPSNDELTPPAPSFQTQCLQNETVISDYERMLQTPQHPEMASSLTDILKVLPNYYRNIKTPTPVKIESIKGAVTRQEGKFNSKHIDKENVGSTGFIKCDD